MNKDKTQNNDKTPKSKLLLKAFEEQIKIKIDLGRERTAKNYRTTIAKIKTYLSEQSDSRPLPTLRLHHIDTQWVQDFTAWLYRQHPDTPGTAGFYLSNFKAMYNHTVEQGQVTYPDSGYPFAHVSIKSPVPFKRSLPQKEVQRLSERNLYAQLTPACRDSLDLFLFIFFCQGISFHDLFTLTYYQMNAPDYILYTRSKTNVPLKVKLTDEMKYILQRHRNPDSPYLFPFLHERRKEKAAGPLNEDSALKRTNRHLKKIGKLLGIEMSLTTYVMRHTFATLMLSSGATVELISQCLGHKSIKTTQIYLSKLTTEKLDKATDTMLDMYIRQPGEQKEVSPPKTKKHRTKTTKKTEKACQTKDLEEKKCPSLNKKRTFADLLVRITPAKVMKTFYIKKPEKHCFLIFFHHILLFFAEKGFQISVNKLY
nr:site-specific integrase [Parabacteroides goldsteinii]